MPVRSRIEFNTGVVSSRNLLATQTRRQSIERRKLQPAVTTNARDRRLAAKITRDEWRYDVTFEVTFQIQNVERKTKLFRNAACVVHVVQRTTTRRQRIAVFVDVDAAPLVPQLHRETDELVPLFF